MAKVNKVLEVAWLEQNLYDHRFLFWKTFTTLLTAKDTLHYLQKCLEFCDEPIDRHFRGKKQNKALFKHVRQKNYRMSTLKCYILESEILLQFTRPSAVALLLKEV